MTRVAYIFPGQGSQSVGMGRDLYESSPSARAVFDRADQTLKFPLSKLCFEGPEDELRQTINAQPALVTASIACLEAAREVNSALPAPAFVAGHSLGEYAALAAAGVVDFATAVYLARERGRLMHQAGQAHPGGMAAVLGMDEASLADACRQGGVWIANINCPGQLVISGAIEDLAKAVELVKSKGSYRVISLQVSGAFHTPLMQPAFDGMVEVVARTSFSHPVIPVIGNTSAQPLTTAESVKAELLQQLCHCVQWQRSMEYMVSNGVSTFIEIGPGKVLMGLARRINKDVNTLNLGDLAAIKRLADPSA